jgi:hypothetical protein
MDGVERVGKTLIVAAALLFAASTTDAFQRFWREYPASTI